MKPNLNLIIASGLAAMLSSCATRPPSEAEGGPRYYYANSASSPSTPSRPSNPSSTAPSIRATPPLAAYETARETSETPWPRVVNSGSATITIYEPQVDSWDGHEIVARNAVGIRRAGQNEPTYGVVTVHAITLVDKSSRNVSLENIRLDGGDFPSARESNQDYMKLLRDNFPKTLDGLSLDRLQISLVVPPEQLKGLAKLNNTPPKIIFSTMPAILVYVDGPPAYRPVTGTELQRLINTRVLLLKDKDGQHYLHLWDGFMTSPGLEGPWTVATKPPVGAGEAERQAAMSQTPVELLNQQAEGSTNAPPSLARNAAPQIYVATEPTELIVFDGDPNFVPINGTHLLYVANTSGNVFRLLTDQRNYVLISGRWFRAPSLDGPWQYVPASQLASDFASIPDNSPKENVKSSVPGTQQATEALLANAIPDSAAVQRNMQMEPPQIDGPPQLRPIGGTPLYYVANSGTPIVKVDEQSWFACENGVWYGATSINGPWVVADSVPAIIYTIPPSSPLHYLTYVRVYGANSEVVYTGYTPGYMGTEVEDGVVVYGSGFYYSPWVGTVWYGYPVSWGFGWGPCWTPWYGWSFAFGFGWGWWGGWGCHPWWGGWHHHGLVATARPGSFSTARNIYPRTGRTGPGTRTVARADSRAGFARAYNSRTGTMAAGQRAAVQNVPNHTQTGAVASSSRSVRPFDTRVGNVSRYGGTSGNSRANSFSRGGPYYSSRPGGAYGYSRGGGPAYGGAPGQGGRGVTGGSGRSGGGEGHSGGGGGHSGGGGGGGGGGHSGGGGGGGGHVGGGGGGGHGQR
jgi:hypothetical protein